MNGKALNLKQHKYQIIAIGSVQYIPYHQIMTRSNLVNIGSNEREIILTDMSILGEICKREKLRRKYTSCPDFQKHIPSYARIMLLETSG